MTLGFITVFGVFGLVISPVASQVQQYLPWFTVAFGVLVAAAGAGLVAGGELPGLRLGREKRQRRSPAPHGDRGLRRLLRRRIANLLHRPVPRPGSHQLPRRLDRRRGDSLRRLRGRHGLARRARRCCRRLARRGLVTGLRRNGRWVPRVGGVLLLVVGAYVAWYGAWELRVLGGDDPKIRSSKPPPRSSGHWPTGSRTCGPPDQSHPPARRAQFPVSIQHAECAATGWARGATRCGIRFR